MLIIMPLFWRADGFRDCFLIFSNPVGIVEQQGKVSRDDADEKAGRHVGGKMLRQVDPRITYTKGNQG